MYLVFPTFIIPFSIIKNYLTFSKISGMDNLCESSISQTSISHSCSCEALYHPQYFIIPFHQKIHKSNCFRHLPQLAVSIPVSIYLRYYHKDRGSHLIGDSPAFFATLCHQYIISSSSVIFLTTTIKTDQLPEGSFLAIAVINLLCAF